MILRIEKLERFEHLIQFCVSTQEMSLLVMEPPGKEVVEKVRGEFDLNERRVREAVEHLKDWIQLQPHLPKEIGKFG
jgi:predicted Zn-dependent protease